MNSYELLKPDGTPSGVWCCAECGRAQAHCNRRGKTNSERNRESAEECCAPRECPYCGKPTEKRFNGQYAWAHDECHPNREPEPPHPSMANPYAQPLYDVMSDIREEHYCAGWMSGNEYMLWSVLKGGGNKYGFGPLREMYLNELRRLSDLAQGWIWTGDDHTPQLITFAEWEPLYKSWETEDAARRAEWEKLPKPTGLFGTFAKDPE